MKQLSEEWFNARRGRITGSRIGAVLGFSPFSSSDDVMRAMVRDHFGLESEFKSNPATEYGQRNEEGAIFDFELKTGWFA